MARYQAVKETHHDPGAGTYTAWGIKGWQAGDRRRTVIAYVPDVFLCKRDAEQFASLCTQLNIAICRLSDVIGDYLGG